MSAGKGRREARCQCTNTAQQAVLPPRSGTRESSRSPSRPSLSCARRRLVFFTHPLLFLSVCGAARRARVFGTRPPGLHVLRRWRLFVRHRLPENARSRQSAAAAGRFARFGTPSPATPAIPRNQYPPVSWCILPPQIKRETCLSLDLSPRRPRTSFSSPTSSSSIPCTSCTQWKAPMTHEDGLTRPPLLDPSVRVSIDFVAVHLSLR